MAQLNGNNVLLEWNGQDVSAFWTGPITVGYNGQTTDITAGANTEWMKKAPGIKDGSASMSLIYDDTSWATYKGVLEPLTQGVLKYFPEGSVSGKFFHEGTMILTDVSVANQSPKKDAVSVALSFEFADAPVQQLVGDNSDAIA